MVEAIFSDMKKLFELVNLNLFRSSSHEYIGETISDPSHPLITISREYGSRGSIVAKRLSNKLGNGWRVYHRDIIDKIAQEARLEKKLIRQVDERQVPIVEEVIGEFFGRRYITLQSYQKHLVRILSAIGTQGKAIIVGRGAHFLFPNALKVRFIASDEYRMQTIMKYDRVSRKRAITIMGRKDKEREEFSRTLFRASSQNPQQFDLTVQMSDDLDVDDVVRMILTLAKRRFTR